MRTALCYSLLLPIFFLGCNNIQSPTQPPVVQKKSTPRWGGITYPASDTVFRLGDALHVAVYNDSAHVADSVLLSVGGQRLLPQSDGLYTTADWQVGIHWLQASFWHDGKEQQVERRKLRILAPHAPTEFTYTVEKEYPHDAKAYTQGLLLRDGVLYESTGQRGQSSLRKVELITGKVLLQHELDAKYFGEGLEYLNGKLFQLTWTSNTGFIYDCKTFEQLGSFNYNTQGWGLTTDGTHLYLSDGSEHIYVLDTTNFHVVRTLQIYTDQGALNYLNEMEWVEGKIYANVYTTDLIAIINPTNGAVEGLVHMEGLLRPSANGSKAEVLNGIAYDKRDKRFYLTGKYWPYLYRVKLFPK